MHFDGDGNLFVWVNDCEQRSVRPAFANIPVGRRVLYGEANRAACLDYIDQSWTDIPPKSLCQKLVEGRGFDN